jgi:hypothetical protein
MGRHNDKKFQNIITYVFKIIFVLELMFPPLKIFQASNQSQPVNVTTPSSEWKVVGFANKTTLPPKILNFCDPFPIFDVEIEEKPVDGQDSGKKTYNIILCNVHFM